jgi:hypothetical protein
MATITQYVLKIQDYESWAATLHTRSAEFGLFLLYNRNYQTVQLKCVGANSHSAGGVLGFIRLLNLLQLNYEIIKFQ